MGIIERHLRRTLKEAPKVFIAEFVTRKLKAAGLDVVLAEDLAKQFIAGGMAPLAFDDSTDRHIDITFTDEDAIELDKAVANFIAGVPALIKDLTLEAVDDLHAATKADWQQRKPQMLAEFTGFRERLEARWRKAFNLLRLIQVLCLDWGYEHHIRACRSRAKSGHALRFVLGRLHGRGCQVYAEILTLMENGYADGAMARWRTLYELMVTATLVRQEGERLATLYLAHDIVESKRAKDEYLKCSRVLGYRPISKTACTKIDKRYANAIDTHGPAFAHPNGWAAVYYGVKKLHFSDIESKAGTAHMRSHYKFSSGQVHADVSGIGYRLGVLGGQDVVLAGASDTGFVEPGQNAAITLIQLTELLRTATRVKIDDSVRIGVMTKLRDDAIEALLSAQRKLDRDARRLGTIQQRHLRR